MSDLTHAEQTIAARNLVLGRPLFLSATTSSTNDDAKQGAREGLPHGAVWVTESQTAGRGRHGRVWVADPGASLLFSVLLRLSCLPARIPLVSLACGLVVRDAIARALGPSRDDDVAVKWPNDVLIGRKKVAGILVESALSGTKVEYVIVGVGINVHMRRIPDELAEIATSLALEGSASPDRSTILTDVLAGLERDVERVARTGLGFLHSRLSKHDALAGQLVESVDGSLCGTSMGIDTEGRLLIRDTHGSITPVSSGEIRIRRR